MSGGRRKAALVAAVALAMTAAACRDSSETSDTTETTAGGGEATPAATADFGDLTDVCQPGDASGATAQGVTDTEIQVGTPTDFGFTQVREFIDAAEAFTAWCNAAGGINGRQLTFVARDAQLFEYRQRILEACNEDFMLVGGGVAFDNTGVRDRLQCLLPEIAAQVVSFENTGSDLQVSPFAWSTDVSPYEGYYRWLVTEAFPESADAIGIIAGDVGVTLQFAARETEVLEFLGAEIVYNDVFPAAGVSDWTPYAQALKSAGVEGMIFLGDFDNLAKLEQGLTDVGHVPMWIDANSNAYNAGFIELGAGIFDQQVNFVPLPIYPLEGAADNPATQQLIDVFAEYAPDATVTGPVVQAWSAWLLFATAASDCGAEVTRRCVLDNASSMVDWSGGGLHAPTDLTQDEITRICFTAVQATSSGWEIADFAPNDGPYRCEDHELQLQGDFAEPMTLEDVGLSLDDLE